MGGKCIKERGKMEVREKVTEAFIRDKEIILEECGKARSETKMRVQPIKNKHGHMIA